MSAGNRVLWTAIAVSFGAHFLLYGWLHVMKQVPAHSHRGVVSVSFVETVSHAVPPPAVQPQAHAKAKSQESIPNPQVPPQAQTASTPAVDPAAQASAARVFITQVTTLLGRSKIYPQEALSREQEGKVVVGITVDRMGEVVASKIEEPSPFQLLNDAALKTVSAVGQFPHVPDEIDAPVHLHIPLIFRIEHN